MNTPKTTVMLLITLISLSLAILTGMSTGADGSGVFTSSPVDSEPLILSENQNNKVLRLWSPPSLTTSVLYDEWEIYLFGEVNETYKVKINGFEAFNGSLDREFVNLSYDASALDRAVVLIEIGNRSYSWSDVFINHQSIGYEGPGVSEKILKYSVSDLNWARLKSAFGVVVASVLTIPFVWKGVRLWRNRQGVVQW